MINVRYTYTYIIFNGIQKPLVHYLNAFQLPRTRVKCCGWPRSADPRWELTCASGQTECHRLLANASRSAFTVSIIRVVVVKLCITLWTYFRKSIIYKLNNVCWVSVIFPCLEQKYVYVSVFVILNGYRW